MSSQVGIDTSPAAHLYVTFAHVKSSAVTSRLSSQGQQRWKMKRKKRREKRTRKKSRDLNQKLARLCYQFGISAPKLLCSSCKGRLFLFLSFFVVQQSIQVSHNGYFLQQFLFFLLYQTWNHSVVIQILLCIRLRVLHGSHDCLSIEKPRGRSSSAISLREIGTHCPYHLITSKLMPGTETVWWAVICQGRMVNTRHLPFCLG